MKTTLHSESERLTKSENPAPPGPLDGVAPAAGNGDGALDVTLGEALRICLDHLHDLEGWCHQVTASLDAIGRITLANAEGLHAITQALARLESAKEQATSTQALPRAEIARLDAQLGQLAQSDAAQSHNLEQVRLQAEALARSFEKLSQEFIVRQVQDPFFLALARVYETIYALSGRPTVGEDELQPVRQRIRDFLEDYHVELIHPDDGERMDPRRHQPVKPLPTADAGQHGRIASTFNVGLVQDGRVIQPARVEVFIFAGTTPVSSIQP